LLTYHPLSTTLRSAEAVTRLLLRLQPDLIETGDALVHAGDSETFGLIVLEAMACGLPAVVTSAGGIAELAAPGTGVVVKPNSASSLAEGIAALYAGDLAGMGERVRRMACTHYDWNRVLPHLLDHYHALRGPGSASAGR
jgi:alpha-1,6-mannosyltransferase